MNDHTNKYASPDQLLLAKLYRYVSLIGFSVIALGFIVYVSGIVPSSVPVGEISSYWHLSSHDFASETGTPQGWDLIGNIGSGDMISLASLVLMPLATILCLSIMAVAFSKGRDWAFLTIVSLQTIVLVLAASGVASGH